ncbi:hypothetical protein [Kitasatospora sp. NPDC096204]|uniref:hypothetical protein n=1 Tax=Kitasatospora sp. NPDC096204 TaxID=3364094 RepID=UPI003819913D
MVTGAGLKVFAKRIRAELPPMLVWMTMRSVCRPVTPEEAGGPARLMAVPQLPVQAEDAGRGALGPDAGAAASGPQPVVAYAGAVGGRVTNAPTTTAAAVMADEHPTAIVDGNGVLHVFAVGTDGRVYFRAGTSATGFGGWQGLPL